MMFVNPLAMAIIGQKVRSGRPLMAAFPEDQGVDDIRMLLRLQARSQAQSDDIQPHRTPRVLAQMQDLAQKPSVGPPTDDIQPHLTPNILAQIRNLTQKPSVGPPTPADKQLPFVIPAQVVDIQPPVPPPGPAQIQDFAQKFNVDKSQLAQAIEKTRPPSAAFERTFTTPKGVQSILYDTSLGEQWVPVGGAFRGVPWGQGAPFATEDQAIQHYHFKQGEKETGIPGTPSIEWIMNNQLAGLNLDPITQRRMAIELQNQYAQYATTLERQRIAARDVINNELMKAALARVMMLGPGATDEDRQKVFDETFNLASRWAGGPRMRTNQIPIQLEEAASQDHMQKVIAQSGTNLLDKFFSPVSPEGKRLPFIEDETAANNLIDMIASAPAISRPAMISQAQRELAQRPQLLEEVIKAGVVAASYPGLERFFPNQYQVDPAKAVPESDRMPVQLERQDSIWDFLPHSIPFGRYPNTIVLPDGRRIPMREWPIAGPLSRGLTPQHEIDREERRARIAASLVRQIIEAQTRQP